MRNICSTLLPVCLTVLSAGSWAGRPLWTEDAAVLGRAECEIEAGHARLAAAGHATEAGLQLGCGIGLDSQLALGGSRQRDGAERGQGLSLGGKTALWATAGDTPETALALAWGLLSTRQGGGGGGWQHVGSAIKLAMSHQLGELASLHVNLGHSRDEAVKSRATTWSLALEHKGLGDGGRWQPMVELVGDDREPPWWNAGLRFAAVPDRFYIDLAHGRQLKIGQPALTSLGFKFAF